MMALNEALIQKSVRLQSRWQGLSRREQVISGIGGIIMMIALISHGVINPVITRQDQAWLQLENSRRLYSEVIEGTEKIRQLQGQGNSIALADLSRPADERVRRAAQNNSIAIHRLTMQQSNMQVQLGEVPFATLIRWLAELEQQGITLNGIQINQTGKPGIVMVDQLRLSEGSLR